MKRSRPKFEEPENHDRWLVSYADFITLLFAFFVVMYSSSSVNQLKYSQLSSAMTTAFNRPKVDSGKINGEKQEDGEPNPPTRSINKIPQIIEPIAPPKTKNDPSLIKQDKINQMEKELTKALKPFILSGKIGVTQTPRGLRIDIKDSFLFNPGSVKIANTEGFDTLEQIAPILLQSGQSIEIEGHTDNAPIKNKSFPSNWELSAIRATTVLNVFAQKGIGEDRLSASGFGASRPIASNDTTEGKSLNRRVSIVILRDSAEQPGSDLLRKSTPAQANPLAKPISN
jgi:chemotaxis protein MotB